MKALLVKTSLFAILIVFILGLAAVGCVPVQEEISTDKTALNAELALEISEMGDYTAASFDEYSKALSNAKEIAKNDDATQEAIDKAVQALTAARLSLTVRPIEEVEGANKSFSLISGARKEISLSDYINVNGLSKITYDVKASNDALVIGPVADGKFTVTAGEVDEATTVKVSINVYYDGVGKRVVDLSVQITNDKAPVLKNEEVVKELDIFDLANKESLVIDLAENVDNPSNLELTYNAKHGEEELVLNGALYTLTLSNYTEQTVYTTFNVTVSCTVNGEERTLEYTYKLGLKDTSAYRVANGNFENGLEGWELTNTVGESPFGGIDNKSTFWSQSFPMFNVGSYFSGVAEGSSEASEGTLASPYFIANSKYATYMLGAAGNHNVYITLENKNGEILAIYRNEKFADLPAGDYSTEELHAMIGNTVFTLNFVTYKIDISAYAGQELRFVIHDHASAGFGFVCFDELNTYYASEDLVPENAVLANNLLADKTALNAEIAKEITEQGDYTPDSYSAYAEKLLEAREIAKDVAVAQATVDEITKALTDARLALTVRPIEEIEGANKSFKLISGGSREIALADYINVNGLSGITYSITSDNGIITLSPLADGKFTVTAGEVTETTNVKIIINVSYYDTVKLTVELSVQIAYDLVPTLSSAEVLKEYDLYTLENKANITLDFAENVINEGNLVLTYSAKLGETELVLDGALYSFVFGSYTDEVVYESITVTVSYVANGKSQTIQYVYKLALKDTSAYRVANGSFENGLDGWELNNTVGESPFGGIDNKTTFWGEGYPMNNVGSYFSSYADGSHESSQGTLASPYFTVKSEYATYMLGGAGNHNVYITIENKDGEILAIYRNEKFADLPAGDYTVDDYRKMIGNTVFLANFVSYKVSLADFMGQEVRFVIHDHASSGWGVVFFDELNTYYASSEAVPENAVLANNLLADKTALNAEIEQAITEQGDYTLDSYTAYAEKLLEAREIANDVAVAQATVDEITKALTDARLALTVRPIEEIEGANKSFRLTSGDSKEITLADYINDNELSEIHYVIYASSSEITPHPIIDGKFIITAGEVDEATTVTVNIVVYYNGKSTLTVKLSVQITNDLAPTLFNNEITESYDVYALDNKTAIELDLSKNVDNPGNLILSYAVRYNDATVSLDGSVYAFSLGNYSDVITYETIYVTISYVANGENQSIEYTYKLAMKDSTEYRLVNGGFENGLDGWTQVGNIGGVSADKNYWVNDPESAAGFEFGMDGDNMFSAYAPGALESAVGTLTSSTFKVGGSGFVSFKIGAMKDGNYVYVDVVDAETKQILARYYNGLWADRTNDVKSGCTLIAYKADLSAFAGREVFFRISDNADSGYGLFFLDSFVTYYETEPDGFNVATPVGYEVSGTIYDLFNGGFEMGDVQGWWNVGEPGKVTNADAFFSGVAYGKVGSFLYSGVEDYQGGNGREGNVGVLTSSVFEIGGNGYITYMLGGGNAFCYVQIIDSTTGEVLARYRQQARNDAVLVKYVADLSAYIGRSVRIQLVDNATKDWGCVSFDDVVTYYDSIPEGTAAIDVKYEIVNGSFENGLDGWNMTITEAGTHNTLGWVESSEHTADWYTKNDDRKDGSFLFTFVRPDGTNCENTKGTLDSAVFTLKANSFVSFRFGAAGSRDVCIQLCKADGSVIATFYNEAAGKKNTEMYAYFYQYTGETTDCFFRVVDNSTSNYGCIVIDDFKVNLEGAPEGSIAAIQ